MKINGNTRLIALLGNPISHSLSPLMHNTSFEKSGEDYVYLCLPTNKDTLGQVIETLKIVGCKGANITYPNKIEIIKYLDELSDEVKIIGACNTIVISEDKKIKGYNTDGRGFVKSLKDINIDLKGKAVAIMGLGGAGSAIATCLSLEGVKTIYVKEKTIAKAEKVKERINTYIDGVEIIITKNEDEFVSILDKVTILINASPAGMTGSEEKFPINPCKLEGKNLLLYDIIYSPLKTPLIERAQNYGIKCLNGIEMMINQGAISYNIWTGQKMDLDLVNRVILKNLGES